MPRSIPIVVALLVHCLAALVSIPWFAISRWSDLTIIGITILLLRFSMHTVGVICIAKRLKWGCTFNKVVFGYYMVTSGSSFFTSFARKSTTIALTENMITVGNAIFFIVFIWLFMRFRSDPSVRDYFERSSMTPQEPVHS